MKLATKIVILLLIATITVTFSGCVEEKEVAPEPEPLHNDTTNISAVNLILLPGIENGLEIRIVSFSSLYMRNNTDKERRQLSEWYYAVYNLSIKNNASDAIDFKANDLHLRAGDQLFNTTTRKLYNSWTLEVLADLGKENRIGDATLLPGQTVNGSVVFCVDSLYDRSFLLVHNATSATSASFGESFEALEVAESFDYSVAFDIPPYSYSIHRTTDSYKPYPEDSYKPYPDAPFMWANWVNRSIFEFYKTADFEEVQSSHRIPVAVVTRYAIKVVSERNLTVVSGDRLLVIDDFGEELINKSRSTGVAILRNRVYESQPEWAIDIPQMNIPDATIVQISFEGVCGSDMSTRFSYSNQDVILDDELNMMLARYNCIKFIS